MTRQRLRPKAKVHLRVVLLAMLAVVASMTLHHGAMAGSLPLEAAHHHLGESSPHCHGDECEKGHAMPACCGMGLCLSALPVGPGASVLRLERQAPLALGIPIAVRWAHLGIDRPPKVS